MTHSLNSYRPWQQAIMRGINKAGIDLFPDGFFGVIFGFYIKPKPGHPPDLSNLQGGIEDVLVKNQNILDDNWKVLNKIYTFGEKSDTDKIMILVAETKLEFLFAVDQYS